MIWPDDLNTELLYKRLYGERGWNVGLWLAPHRVVTRPYDDYAHMNCNSCIKAYQICNQPPSKVGIVWNLIVEMTSTRKKSRISDGNWTHEPLNLAWRFRHWAPGDYTVSKGDMWVLDGNRIAWSHSQMKRHRVSSSSVVRASGCITEGRGFKSYLELGFFSKLMSFQLLNQGISIIIQLHFVEYK